MSSFICEICNTEIIDTSKGYTTGCTHYPIAVRTKNGLTLIEGIMEMYHNQPIAREMLPATMDLDEYQQQAAKTAIYPGQGSALGLYYTVMGLAGEVGEVAGKTSKIIRDNNERITSEAKQALISELGDVLWFVAMTASELGVHLNNVAWKNLMKLDKRKQCGKIGGSGDER